MAVVLSRKGVISCSALGGIYLRVLESRRKLWVGKVRKMQVAGGGIIRKVQNALEDAMLQRLSLYCCTNHSTGSKLPLVQILSVLEDFHGQNLQQRSHLEK